MTFQNIDYTSDHNEAKKQEEFQIFMNKQYDKYQLKKDPQIYNEIYNQDLRYETSFADKRNPKGIRTKHLGTIRLN